MDTDLTMARRAGLTTYEREHDMTYPLFVILAHGRTLTHGIDGEGLAEDFAASLSTGESRLVDISTADVATIATVAVADCPRLNAKGGGPFGAGTHPAQPYLESMLTMVDVGAKDGFNIADVRFGMDDAQRIVITFLSNASSWRGPVAREAKARLREILRG